MIDVIITTHNRLELLNRTIESFLANTDLEKIHRIIITDDGSTDGTAEYLEQLRTEIPKIKVLGSREQRRGIIPRFNAAIEQCERGIVCEFQDDVTFYPDWLNQQLAHIDVADFVTGYDAPEHTPYSGYNGYKLKYSSRFTQLMARRHVWDQFFPMQPRHNFPTPCMVDGKPVGSGIDCMLFGGKKNNKYSKSRFLVIPGLCHTAEHYQSTWRPDISMRPDGKISRPGGLLITDIKTYWKNRYESQKHIAVGFAGRPQDEQDVIVKEKREFVSAHLDTSLNTIDYGCGIGLFSNLFIPGRYKGQDITREFVEIARQSNPEYKYQILDEPLPEMNTDCEQFFTCNVLQHNSDYVVSEIFRRVKDLKPAGVTFSLYENTHQFKNTHHMRFRTVQEYISFVADHFKVVKSSHWQHTVHGQEHSLISVQC